MDSNQKVIDAVQEFVDYYVSNGQQKASEKYLEIINMIVKPPFTKEQANLSLAQVAFQQANNFLKYRNVGSSVSSS